jgi:hypothetical protein
VQEQSTGLLNHLDDTFEVRGKKTEAQLALEQWNAEMANHKGTDPSLLDDDEYLIGGMSSIVPNDEVPIPPSSCFGLDEDEDALEHKVSTGSAPSWSDMSWSADRFARFLS